MMANAEKYGKLTDTQYGGRRHRQTHDALLFKQSQFEFPDSLEQNMSESITTPKRVTTGCHSFSRP